MRFHSQRALTILQTCSYKLGTEVASSPKYEDMQDIEWKPSEGWPSLTYHIMDKVICE